MTTIAKAGTLLSVESGCYSSYGVKGFFVVLREFTPAEKLNEYLKANPEQAGDYTFEEDQFLAALLAEGLLLEIPYGVMHLTDYSRASEFNFTPVGE
jgi:hypothetical protein